jgi:translocator protein
MGVSLLGIALQLVAVACFLPVLVHAFGRSVGTGFMVLCLPVYAPYYAFSQFEHRFRGPLLFGWLGGTVLGVVLRAAGFELALPEL